MNRKMIAPKDPFTTIIYSFSLGSLLTAMEMNNAKKIGFLNKILNHLQSMDLDLMEVVPTIKVALDEQETLTAGLMPI